MLLNANRLGVDVECRWDCDRFAHIGGKVHSVDIGESSLNPALIDARLHGRDVHNYPMWTASKHIIAIRYVS